MLSPTPLSVNSQLYANILTAVEINNCKQSKPQYPVKHTTFSQYSGSEPAFSIHGSSNELDRLTNAPNTYKTNPIYSSNLNNLQQFKEKFFNDVIVEKNAASDSEEDEKVTADDDIYATLSNHSLCSATTDANDDFEFYNSETNIEKYNDKISESKAEETEVKDVKEESEDAVSKPVIRVHKKKEPDRPNCRVYVSVD